MRVAHYSRRVEEAADVVKAAERELTADALAPADAVRMMASMRTLPEVTLTLTSPESTPASLAIVAVIVVMSPSE